MGLIPKGGQMGEEKSVLGRNGGPCDEERLDGVRTQ